MTKKMILSVDGGGIRGLIPAIVLAELERRLGDRGKTKPLCKYFDLMAGTSTGGIIVAGLACPREDSPSEPVCSAQDLVDLYEDEGGEIFERGFFSRLRSALTNPAGLFDERYSSTPLRDKLAVRLGDRKISQALTGVVITAYDISRRRAVFMTNGKDHDGSDSDDYLFREAALATASAPTYFEPALVQNLTAGTDQSLVDGGVFANDPSLAAFVEAKKQPDWGGDKNIVMLSLGTGNANRPYSHAEVRNWGALSWINPARGAPIISVLMHGQASTVSYQMQSLFGDRYFRISGPLDRAASDDMDDATPENLASLRRVAEGYIEKHSAKLDAVADLA